MGIATHLGPWLLGTVKETTGPSTVAGAAAGQVRNTGATHSIQFRAITGADITAQTFLACIPAGSTIQSIALLVTTAYATTTPTYAFFVNGTAINAATAPSITFGNTGRAGFTLGTANPALVANVGSADAIISFTQANVTGVTGAGILEISYIVRNQDGTAFPASA